MHAVFEMFGLIVIPSFPCINFRPFILALVDVYLDAKESEVDRQPGEVVAKSHVQRAVIIPQFQPTHASWLLCFKILLSHL